MFMSDNHYYVGPRMRFSAAVVSAPVGSINTVPTALQGVSVGSAYVSNCCAALFIGLHAPDGTELVGCIPEPQIAAFFEILKAELEAWPPQPEQPQAMN
jgi:hypothetical protein